jgi:hypothetical protein
MINTVKFLDSATVKLMYALRFRPVWLGDVELLPPEGAVANSLSKRLKPFAPVVLKSLNYGNSGSHRGVAWWFGSSVSSNDVWNGCSVFMFRVKQSKNSDCLNLKIVITILHGVTKYIYPATTLNVPENLNLRQYTWFTTIIWSAHTVSRHVVTDSTLAAVGMLRRVKRQLLIVVQRGG